MNFFEQQSAAIAVKVSEIEYHKPMLSGEGSVFTLTQCAPSKAIVEPDHPFYAEVSEPFTWQRFLSPRRPIDLGSPNVAPESLSGVPNILRMPVKFPNTEYRLPVEVAPLEPFVRQIAEYEAGINPLYDSCFVHLTADTRLVKANASHRLSGFHSDGIEPVTCTMPTEHCYVAGTAPGTEFCILPFFLDHINPSRYNIFHEMERQAKPENVYAGQSWHLYLLDPYVVHRSPFVSTTLTRVFLRLTFAYKELEDDRNTVNPMFGGQQYQSREDIRNRLLTYDGEMPVS